MERQGVGPFSRTRGSSVVASAPMKLLCVLWLLSGGRPDEDVSMASTTWNSLSALRRAVQQVEGWLTG